MIYCSYVCEAALVTISNGTHIGGYVYNGTLTPINILVSVNLTGLKVFTFELPFHSFTSVGNKFIVTNFSIIGMTLTGKPLGVFSVSLAPLSSQHEDDRHYSAIKSTR